MSSGLVLVVDDEPDIRTTVKEILEDEGYQVVVAENAAAAREARRQFRPDVVLLDIWMPDLDGISLLREWSANGAPACPVIMMSGHGGAPFAAPSRRRLIPSRSAIQMSSSTTSGRSWRRASRAAAAFSATTT